MNPDAETKRTYSNPYKREPVSMILQDRDVEILRAVNRCRYLRCDHFHALVSDPNSGRQTIQRRLKKLFSNGYLGRFRPYVRLGDEPPFIAYYLGDLGAEQLRSLGEDVFVYGKKDEVSAPFFFHTLALAQFRVWLELSIRNQHTVGMKSFWSDFEVDPHMREFRGKRRYRVYEETGSYSGQKRSFIFPDATILLHSIDDPSLQMLLFVEIDRGTEPLHIIKNKLVRYEHYVRNCLVPIRRNQSLLGYRSEKHGALFRVRILFQAQSSKRVHSILKTVQQLEKPSVLLDQDMVLGASVKSLSQETILTGKVWQSSKREYVRMVKV